MVPAKNVVTAAAFFLVLFGVWVFAGFFLVVWLAGWLRFVFWIFF